MKGKKTLYLQHSFGFFTGVHFISAVLYPFYKDWSGFDESMVIFYMLALQSWFMIALFVMETPTGWVADKIGRKWSLALGAIPTGVGAFVYTIKPELGYFLAGEFIWALGLGTVNLIV